MLAFVLLLLLCFLSGEFSTMPQSPILLLYGKRAPTPTTTTTSAPRSVWRPPSTTTVFVFSRDTSVQVSSESSVPPPPPPLSEKTVVPAKSFVPPPPPSEKTVVPVKLSVPPPPSLSQRVQTVAPTKKERVAISWLEAAERFRPKETPRAMTKEDQAARNRLNALDARSHDERRFLGTMSTRGGIPWLKTDQRRRWQITAPTTPFPAREIAEPSFPGREEVNAAPAGKVDEELAARASEKEEKREIVAPAGKEAEMTEASFPAEHSSEKEEAREIDAPTTTMKEAPEASFPAALVSQKEEGREIVAPAGKEAEMTEASFPRREDAREIAEQAGKEVEMTKPTKKEEASAALSSTSPNESASEQAKSAEIEMTKPAKKEEASAALSTASPNESVSEQAKSAETPAVAKKEEAALSYRESANVSSTPQAKPTTRLTIEQVRQ